MVNTRAWIMQNSRLSTFMISGTPMGKMLYRFSVTFYSPYILPYRRRAREKGRTNCSIITRKNRGSGME